MLMLEQVAVVYNGNIYFGGVDKYSVIFGRKTKPQKTEVLPVGRLYP